MVLDRSALTAAVLLTLALPLAGCGSSGPDNDTADTLDVVVSFYPLAYLVDAIGGDAVHVTNLTAPGAEPHDLELSPRDVGAVTDADLTVYLSGFQAAVDQAVDQAEPDRVLDVAAAADLTRTFAPIEDGESHDDEAGAVDPHFWLDPQRYGAVAKVVEQRLAAADPDHSASFESNLARVESDLGRLDDEFRSGLAHCERPDLVTSHNAFGYLAERYGLQQVGITGLTPESEPNADRLATITDFVRDHHVETIYFETLVSPAVAQTVAGETGADTAVLDPIEGLTDASDGDDYLAVMRSNLQTLRRGQACG